MTSQQDPRLVEASWLLDQRRYKDAHTLCMAMVQADPTAAAAFALLGRIGMAVRQFDQGAAAFQRAWALDPENAAYGAGYARCMLVLKREPPALAAAEMALAFGPRDAETFDILGVIFSRVERDAEAARCFQEAVALDPKRPGHQLNLGWALQRLGDIPAAELAFRACLTLEPANDRAILALVNLKPQTMDHHFAPQLFKAFEQIIGHPDQMLRIGHALAKTFEDQDLPDLAFDWLLLAKGGKAPGVADLEVWQAGLFQAACATTPAQAGTGRGDPSDAPIFLVGLPGGETDALSAILAAHPLAGAAGESQAFALTARRLAGSPTRDLIDGATLRKAVDVSPSQLGAAYLETVRARVPSARRIIDRQPLNSLYAGLIHRALPNGRIIALRRRPVDGCLAVLRQPFAAELRHLGWTYDLNTLARFWLDHDKLLAHWRETLPADRYLELDWDVFIADPDGQTRALVAWLDLPWAQAVGDAARANAPAPPRDWRRYGPKVRPLVDALVAGGAMSAR